MKTKLAPSNLLFLLLSLGAGAALAQNPSARLQTTFTNPAPAAGGFGQSVAAVGTDRVIIGSAANVAYLFTLNGTLQKTFTVSDPIAFDFGGGVTAVGSDRVLISAVSYGQMAQIGRVYLFNTNGSLLTTFTNPNPARVQAFGAALAAMRSDRVLIGGVENRSSGLPFLGAVYLFSTNGTLLRTFANPAPAAANTFGGSVAAVGSDRVLIGAMDADTGARSSGAAYLFSTDGILLRTFANPSPAQGDRFGRSVAAVGNDRVIIGASADSGGTGGGRAYLFSTDGTLLTTFTNSTSVDGDGFGTSVAAVGTSRVLIGAQGNDTGAPNSGAAHLFSTNGTLLTTFTNPTPVDDDGFGSSVAAVGKDQVLIGAFSDNTGATDAGAAYLFDLPYPPLGIARNGSSVSLKWTTPETGLGLQQADALSPSPLWTDTTNLVSVHGPTNVVQQPIAGANTNRFFRLRRP